MSLAQIRNALESAVDGMTPPLPTAHQGETFAPVIGTPWLEIFFLPATPDNPTMGDGFYIETGILQVTLHYPAGEGTAAATARAEAIRALLKRGATFNAGTIVQITRTPSITDGEGDEGFIALIVRATWRADVYA